MLIAIYLGWIRHNACGGVESFTRNLLDGFTSIKDDTRYVLICSSDNASSFEHYATDNRFRVVNTGIATSNLKKTLLFEALKLDKLVSRIGANICFVPSYRVPMLNVNNKYVAVIHDLQVYHYPENFGLLRRTWLRIGAWRAVKNSSKIVAISDFVGRDIMSKLNCSPSKISVILNPILPNIEEEDFNKTSKELKIEKEKYHYTISALAKNKNLITLLRLMKLIIDTQPKGISNKLVISGIGLRQKDADNIDSKPLFDYIENNHLQEHIIFTGFVTNERRNSLIKNSQFFLFPSVFEGFGMPVIEAMELGGRVITTSSTSIPEVTENKAVYIDDYYDENKWLDTMKAHLNDQRTVFSFPTYDVSYVAKQYNDIFKNVALKQ